MVKEKLKTIFLWEGLDTATITRGVPLKPCIDNPHMKQGECRHKGLFSQMEKFTNIPDTLIEAPKRIFAGKILNDWQFVKIRMDYATMTPFNQGVSPKIMNIIEQLTNDCEMWKRKYYDAQRSKMDESSRDRIREQTKKDFKFAGQVRQMLYSPSDQSFINPGFASRFGFNQPPGGDQ